MDLSIIIPTYNRRDLVKYTLDSVAPQLHPGVAFETIVVDDRSDDGTEDFIKASYPDVIYLQNPRKGAPAARNTGLQHAKGKYVLFLDSDDLIGEKYFKKKIELLDQQPTVTACYGAYEAFRSDGAFTIESIAFKHKYPLLTQPDSEKTHLVNYLRGYYLPPITVIWRKDFLTKLGGYDESLIINQDVELMMRGFFEGMKLLAINDGTLAYNRIHSLDNRVGSRNSRAKLEAMLSLRINYFEDLKKYGLNDIEYKKALSLNFFNQWRLFRNIEPDVALEFLNWSKKVYWPVDINGGKVFKALTKILGPVAVVKLKSIFSKQVVNTN